MHAETVYLFRHALMREAAYQLQMPGDRARLHGLAVDVIEEVIGAVPQFEERPFILGRKPHAADPFAEELARHAGGAADGLAGSPRGEFYERKRALYLWRSAIVHRKGLRMAETKACCLAVAEHPATPPAIRIAALTRAGHACVNLGSLQQGEQLMTCALQAARELGDAESELVVTIDLAGVSIESDNLESGEALLDIAKALVQRVDNPMKEVDVLTSLGILRAHQDRIGEALSIQRQAHAIAVINGDLKQQALILGNLGNALSASGAHEEARQALERSIELKTQIGDVMGLASILASMASLCVATGKLDQAEELARKAITMAQEQGARRLQARRMTGLAEILKQRGRVQDAMQTLHDAAALAHDVGDPSTLKLCETMLNKLSGGAAK